MSATLAKEHGWAKVGGGHRDAWEIGGKWGSLAHLVGEASLRSLLFFAVCGLVMPPVVMQPSCFSNRTSSRMFCSFLPTFCLRRSFRRSPLCEGMRARRENVLSEIGDLWTSREGRRPLSLLVSLHGHVRKTPGPAQINRPQSWGGRGRYGFVIFEIGIVTRVPHSQRRGAPEH